MSVGYLDFLDPEKNPNLTEEFNSGPANPYSSSFRPPENLIGTVGRDPNSPPVKAVDSAEDIFFRNRSRQTKRKIF